MSERKTFPVEMVRAGDCVLIEEMETGWVTGKALGWERAHLVEVEDVAPDHLITDRGNYRTEDDSTEYRIVEIKRDGEWLTDEPTDSTFTPDPDEVKEWPQKGDWYFVVISWGSVARCLWNNSEHDRRMKDHGNCFRTREEAEAAALRVRRAYRGESEGGDPCSS